MKKILISGGAGFIGSNLVNALYHTNEYEIVVLDNLSRQIHGENPEVSSPLYKSIIGKVTFINGSVESAKDWQLALQGVDSIIHLAAETGTGQSMYEIKKYVDVNIGGTALLLDILANEKHQVKKVIIASSRAIYGEGRYHSSKMGYIYPTHRLPDDMDNGNFEVSYCGADEITLVSTDEASKIHPSSVYGITKQNQEQMIMTVCPTIGIAPVAFRYQNVYGPGQSLSNPYTGILSIFSTLIKNGRGINVFEDGKESRDFVFIEDVVDATIAGLESDKANGEIFNVGYGAPTDVLTIAKTLMKLYKADLPITISGAYRLGDIRHNYADMTKIKTKLGFTPKTDFETGITQFVNWVNEQDIAVSRYDESLSELRTKGLLKQ